MRRTNTSRGRLPHNRFSHPYLMRGEGFFGDLAKKFLTSDFMMGNYKKLGNLAVDKGVNALQNKLRPQDGQGSDAGINKLLVAQRGVGMSHRKKKMH